MESRIKQISKGPRSHVIHQNVTQDMYKNVWSLLFNMSQESCYPSKCYPRHVQELWLFFSIWIQITGSSFALNSILDSSDGQKAKYWPNFHASKNDKFFYKHWFFHVKHKCWKCLNIRIMIQLWKQQDLWTNCVQHESIQLLDIGIHWLLIANFGHIALWEMRNITIKLQFDSCDWHIHGCVIQ